MLVYQQANIEMKQTGLSENVGYIPNEIVIFHRDNDQQNQLGLGV